MIRKELGDKPIVVENFRQPSGDFEADNPFLLNLPACALDDENAQQQSMGIFSDEVGFTEEDRNECKEIRSRLLSRMMNNYFLPLPWHTELSQWVDRLIFASYDRIDPFDEKRRNEKHMDLGNHDFDKLELEKFTEDERRKEVRGIDTAALGRCLIGFSGAGKTSALDLKLRPLRQVYEFHSFNGMEFCAYQMPVLLVKCPDSGSIKDLVDAVFREIYARTSLKSFNIKVRASKNIDDYVEKIAHALTTLNVGLLCIDDSDNIAAMTRDKERLTRFLAHLMNSVDTSFLFAGTEELYKILKVEYSRRRLTSGDVIKAEYFSRDDESRESFVKNVWYEMNILKTENEYTDEIDSIMYTATLGSPAGFKMLYSEIQNKALFTEDEKITVEIVEECARNYMRLRREERQKILTHPLDSYKPASGKLPEQVGAEELIIEAKRLGFELPEKKLWEICDSLADRLPRGNMADVRDLLVMTLNKSIQKGVQNA